MILMDDLRPRLEQHLGNEYVVERELGGGGMARVFLALETALGRQVVIKVLVPELAADLSGRRFEREIMLAASLQHANIVPLLRAGDAGGQPYYVMPYVDGRSLRDWMRERGKPELGQSIGIMRDIARALAYAHDRGVVHRDIKPDNVLLSGDAAVVSDFGIAKAIAIARDRDTRGDGTPTGGAITMTGMMVGTPAYAAPEQVAGDRSIDHRADLYSFGVVAYEMLAGRPPFSGTSAQRLLAQHLAEAPVPLGERCPDCPPVVTHLVMQCLEKLPERRPESMRDVLAVLDGATTPAGTLARIRQRVTRRQRIAGQAVAGLAIVGLASTLTVRALLPDPERVVAVIPFLNERPDTTGDYLADGMADGLATSLGRTSGIRLVSRSVSARYRGRRSLDAIEVGQALSAEYLVQGTVRETEGRLLVSVHVSCATDNSEVWSSDFEGRPDDVLALQDAVSAGVVAGLAGRLGITPGIAATNAGGGTADRNAYDDYLRARYLALRRGSGVRQSIELYERAIAADPGFGRAHAGLALALQLLPYFEPVDARTLYDRTRDAVRHALDVDPTLGEAHVALALAYQHAFQWDSAEASYRHAVALAPDEPDVNIQYARFLWYVGRGREALQQFERARQADPYSAVASGWLGALQFRAGDRERGLGEMLRALQLDSTNPPTMIFAAKALADVGRQEEARRILQRLWEQTPSWRAAAAQVLAATGEPQRAREMLTTLPDAAAGMPLVHTMTAGLTLSLGDTAAALNALERAADAGEILPTYWSLSSEEFDPLRTNARFAEIVRRFGLDVRVFTAPRGGRP
jgi:serine/threonine-protein kinase